MLGTASPKRTEKTWLLLVYDSVSSKAVEVEVSSVKQQKSRGDHTEENQGVLHEVGIREQRRQE